MYSSSPVVTYAFGYEGSLIKETNNNLAYVHRIINKKHMSHSYCLVYGSKTIFLILHKQANKMVYTFKVVLKQ